MIHRYFINKVKKVTGSQIYYGPFCTLNIPDKLYSYMTIGEIIGTYESCLHNALNKIIALQPNNVMVIGANHGYYCAGLAYTLNPATLIAYEIDQNLIEVAKEWWKVNQLSPITFRGEANAQEFKTIHSPVDLIICDCEGAEESLLDPSAFIWQKNSIIIVEMHDFYRPGLTQLIISRFKNTHETQVILDDFNEDELNKKILRAVHPSYWLVKHKIVRFPHHRWIIKNNTKVFGAGKFLVLWPKSHQTI